MVVQLGDAFLPSFRYRSVDTHLWVVVSNPALDAERVLILNLTTWRQGIDHSCVIEPEEHTRVSHRTCVNYSAARITTAARLAVALGKGLLEKKDPVSSQLLQRILRGAAISDELPLGCAELLRRQGLLPDDERAASSGS